MSFADYPSPYTKFFKSQEPLALELGGELPELQIAYRVWGKLNESGDNAILICHGLTGSADADMWWKEMFGRGRAFNEETDFIVSTNALGSCYGTTGPVSINPLTEKPYGAAFPLITIRDMVRAQKRLMDFLGVQRVKMVIGGSLGGMQALEWALMYPDFIESVVTISASGRHSAWCIGVSEAQRQAIYADADFKDGNYDPRQQPRKGLAAARMMAMLTYRSFSVFQERFARRRQNDDLFEVESYLRYQGQKLVERFDANAYITLTKAMDTHDVARDRGEYETVLKELSQPTLVVSASSDILYFPEEQEELARLIPNAELAVMQTNNGHDAFLIDIPEVARLVADFRRRVFLAEKA
ncbi:MAG: homoserine O-acetyltransferase [Chloroherpetonaceae bacterium]|nr:homoserine O-acetyltransferase [Chloroherpetonaceae bacterium]MDW8438393.1 homoserine O-acetyltransferase [Chloroherpetonaceae bacterium]